MLFQPSNIAPSTLSGIGIGTVDVTLGLDVSWQVNGDSPMTDYQITIYQNDTASTQMYTTGKITLGTPFQPHDVKGNPMFFSTTISAATLSTAGIVNGYANGYKMLITQWWGANDYVEQSSASVFITRSTPTLSIDAIPNPVTTSALTITASYAQAEGDPISTVEWIFAIAGMEDRPIKETGTISTQVLSFNVDGLISGYTYSVMCNVVSSNGMEVSTGYIQFVVSYPSSSINLNTSVAQMKNSSAVYLTWDSLGNNIISYPYYDSTKTTNGITFTVNGEGDVVATGTASADAYFTIAQGTLTQIGISAGQKLIITSGYSGANVVVEETNNSNVLVSTITSSEPLQYIVPNTTNTLKISFVIPSGSVISTGETLQPMMCLESDIAGVNSMSAAIEPVQNLHGYSSPWLGGAGENLFEPIEGSDNTITFVAQPDGSVKISGTGYITKWTGRNVIYDLPYNGINAGDTVTIWSDIFFVATPYNGNTSLGQKTSANGVATTFTIPANANKLRLGENAKDGQVQQGEVIDVIGHFYIGKVDSFTAWSPFENVCPIVGSAGLSVYVSPTQDQQDATTYASDWTSTAGTVYGGTLNVVTGVLTVTHGFITLVGGNEATYSNNGHDNDSTRCLVTISGKASGVGNMTSNQFVYTNSNHYGKMIGRAANNNVEFYLPPSVSTDVEDQKAWFSNNPTEVCFELAAPQTFQLGADYIATLLYGSNNIWATSGNITLSYTKNTGAWTTVSGPIVSFSDSNAKDLPTPQYVPGITGLSIYRYFQGEPILHRVYDFSVETTSLLDYYAPSQNQVAYLIVVHSSSADLFSLTSNFTPVFWFYSILLCNQDSNGKYHVQKEFIFKYGVETGAVSNNNAPSLQQNFTSYPTRQPTSSLYRTGSVKGYIGTVSNQKIYSDSVSLQNAIYAISTSTLTKFLKTRKGETIMVECSGPIQMQIGDNMREQPLVATIDWVEVGDASDASIVSIPSDGFWPLP